MNANESSLKGSDCSIQSQSSNVKLNKRGVLYLLTFISGFASLGYQYFWFKSLTVTVGVDLYSSSVVIAGFFLGLGLGTLFFSRDKFRDLAYFKLEFYVTALAILCSFISQSLWLYLNLSEMLGIGALVVTGITFAIPAFFMGGTLLALIRLFIKLEHPLHEGIVYGVNLFGAMLGLFLSASVLLPLLGVTKSLYLLYSLNAFIVLVGFWVEKNVISKPLPSKATSSVSPRYDLIALYALTGFCSLSYEISWLQLLNQIIPSRSINYSVIVTVMLGGLGIGSTLFASLKLSRKAAYRSVLILSSLSVISPLCFIFFLSQTLAFHASNDIFYFMVSFFDYLNGDLSVPNAYWQLRILEVLNIFPIVLFTVFIPSILFGAIFPLVIKISRRSDAALDTGVLLGTNTLAGVLATILTGFILIPSLGVVPSLKVIMWIGIVFITFLSLKNQGAKKWAFIAILLSCGFVIQHTLPTNKTHLLLAERYEGTETESVFFTEGKGYSISVFQENSGSDSFKRLFVRGESNTADSMPSLRYMRLQSYLPYFVHNSEPKDALVIGLGTGITAGAFSQVDSINSVDVFELLPDMIEATQLFKESNYDIVNQDKVNVTIGDGRLQLAKTDKMYDIITLEPPPPSSAGVNNLYSSEFYQLAKARMNRDGIVAQWFPLTTQSSMASRAILNTMMENFKFVNVWYTERFEALIIGSDHPFNKLTFSDIQSKWDANPKIASSLAEVGIENTTDLIATYLGSNNDFITYLNDSKLITDDNALLEVDQYNIFIDDILFTYQEILTVFEQSEFITVPNSYQLDLNHKHQLQRLMLTDAFNKTNYGDFEGDPYVDWLISSYSK